MSSFPCMCRAMAQGHESPCKQFDGHIVAFTAAVNMPKATKSISFILKVHF